MSEVSTDAELTLLMADFAALDPQGKLNLLGGGVNIIGYDPMQGVTARFTVVGRVRIPAKYTPTDVTVEISLLDDAGDVVLLGAPNSQPFRLAQVAKIEKPNVIGMPTLPPELLAQHIMVLDIPGLPLQPGRTYSWSLRVDGDEENARRQTFLVPGIGAPPIVPG